TAQITVRGAMKAGICVSTVSNAVVVTPARPGTGRLNLSESRLANATGRSRCRLVADAADGTDDIFLSCTYPNDPASGPAFPAEGNVDAQGPQERLRDAGGQGVRKDFSANRLCPSRCPHCCDLRLPAEGRRRFRSVGEGYRIDRRPTENEDAMTP